MKRRDFLKWGANTLAAASLPGCVFSPPRLLQNSLDSKVLKLTPFERAREEDLEGVYWTKSDLEDLYPQNPIDSENIRKENEKLKDTKIVALRQSAEPYDFLGSVADIETLCQDREAINHFTTLYEPEGMSRPSTDDFDIFEAPKTLPEHHKFFPSIEFLTRQYEQAEDKAEFLKRFGQYAKEVSEVEALSGFNAHLSLSTRDMQEATPELYSTWLENSSGVSPVLDIFSAEDLETFSETIKTAPLVTLPRTNQEYLSYLDKIGYKGHILDLT
tara:strand:- start:468 stop:1286 length:819 start_codon:yes stop_codon:yes gene_type:complete